LIPASHFLSSRIGFRQEAQDAPEGALKVNPNEAALALVPTSALIIADAILISRGYSPDLRKSLASNAALASIRVPQSHPYRSE
jgi:hypothetical protein